MRGVARPFIEAILAHDLDAAEPLLDPDVETVTPRGSLHGAAACRQVLQKAIGDEQFTKEQTAPELEEAGGDVIARTMGMTTFALFRLFSSLEEADEDESVFAGAILANRPLLIGTAISVASIVLATEFGLFQRVLGTASLSIDQWAVCILVALSLIVVEEIRKALKLRTADRPQAAATTAAATA